jgi:diguanylate cyclase (GGDEF)-like protein/PAS domain S-box-containing protein
VRRINFLSNRAEEEARRALGSRVLLLFECSPLAMGLFDAGGRTLTTNPAYSELTGHDSQTLRAMFLGDLTHPDESEREALLLQELITGSRTSYSLDKRVVRASRSTLWTRATVFVVDTTEGGEPVLAQILEDIDERKMAETRNGSASAALSLQLAAMQSLSSEPTLEASLPALLGTLCEGGGWDAATFWRVNTHDADLKCVGFYCRRDSGIHEFAVIHDALTLARGTGLAGRAWADAAPVWTTDVGQDDAVARALRAAREGIATGFAVPVLLHREVRGVLELFSREVRPSDTAVIGATSMIAEELARFVEREDAEDQLEASDQRTRWIAQRAGDAVVTVGDDGILLDVNEATAQIFGYEVAELIGQPLTILMPENLRESHRIGFDRFMTTGKRAIRWEHQRLPGRHKSGSQIELDISLMDYQRGSMHTVTALVRDVTERKAEETALVRQSLHDSLTGLPNRTLLAERLERAILVGHRTSIGLIFMDLDRFKQVNDTFGHQKGDQLLQEVARRILRVLREADTLARLSGDEFAVLLPATDEPGVVRVAERIEGALREPFVLDRQTFSLSASMGIAMHPQHAGDAATLMQRAESAVYHAKQSDGHYAIYEPQASTSDPARLLLSHELGEGIDANQLVLYYQPKVNLGDGKTEQVEALVRWNHPERGLTPPAAFIPLAEETGLVKPLTTWTLTEALKQHKAWLESGHRIRVGVNFSARLLIDPHLVDLVTDVLRTYDVEPSFLQAEVTESAIMTDPDRALTTLTDLRNAGVRIAIDDFGVGYASLNYLKKLPADELKIDKSFVLDMAASRDDASIVRSVITLGHNLGLRVVAEGVDNKRAVDMLAEMGCDMAQGYFLSRPLPAPEVTEWLRRPPVRLAASQ